MRKTTEIKVDVKLETEEIKALKTLAEIDCVGICCFECPLDCSQEFCIKITAKNALAKLGGENLEQTNINND